MAFTENCDVFGAVHERGLNRIGQHLMYQRPSLFNYGTRMFASNPDEFMCESIKAHPEVIRRNNPLVTVESPLPIAGTDGALGMNYCFQITMLKLDFHPGNSISLPPELGSLPAQRMAMMAKVCGAIVCPDGDIIRRYEEISAARFARLRAEKDDVDRSEEPPSLIPIPGRHPICFCLELFGVTYFETVGPSTAKKLAIRLQDIEIVDIEPGGLENSLECYIATTIRVGILPRIRIALDTIDFALGTYANLAISPTPRSTDVPNNPAIEDDQLMAFINVGVSSP